MILKAGKLPSVSLDNSGQKINIGSESIIIHFIQYIFHDIEEQKATAGQKNLAEMLDLPDFKDNNNIVLRNELLVIFNKFKEVAESIGEMTFKEIDAKKKLHLPKVGQFEIFTLEGGEVDYIKSSKTDRTTYTTTIKGLNSLKLNTLTASKRDNIIEQGMWTKEGTDYREGKHRPHIGFGGSVAGSEETSRDMEDPYWIEENERREKGKLPPVTQQEIDDMMDSKAFKKIINLEMIDDENGELMAITFNDLELKKHHFRRLAMPHIRTKRPKKTKSKVTIGNFWEFVSEDSQRTTANSSFSALFSGYISEKPYKVNKLPLEYSDEVAKKYTVGENIIFRNKKYIIEDAVKIEHERGDFWELTLNKKVISINKNDKVSIGVATLNDKPVTITKYNDKQMIKAISEMAILHNPNMAYSYRIPKDKTEVIVTPIVEFIFTTDVSGKIDGEQEAGATNDKLYSPFTSKLFERGDKKDSKNRVALPTYFTSQLLKEPTLLNNYKDKGSFFFKSIMGNYAELKQAIEDSLDDITGGN